MQGRRFRAIARMKLINIKIMITVSISVPFFLWFYYRFISSSAFVGNSGRNFLQTNNRDVDLRRIVLAGPCAINFYGLPRKFKDLVLPGLVENVIRPNARYQCDYFVHYYDKRIEAYDRGADSGRVGMIDPDEVVLLEEAVLQEYRSMNVSIMRESDLGPPGVYFNKETEQNFFDKYNALLDRIHNERGSHGKLLFMPLNEIEPYPNDTITNIVKMWHSQETVWNLMEHASESKASLNSKSSKIRYSRIAMFRNDVLFVTPVDIYQMPDGSLDLHNKYAVIPDFSKFPVNDRMIYGPFDAVEIWATGKFRRMRKHAERIAFEKPGDGIHPERYLHRTIFPAIRDAGIEIRTSPSEKLCFLRVRADSSIRASDCGKKCVSNNNWNAIQHLLKRPCLLNVSNPDVAFFECGDVFSKSSSYVESLKGSISWKGCK